MDAKTLVDIIGEQTELVAKTLGSDGYTHAIVHGDWSAINEILGQYQLAEPERIILGDYSKKLWRIHTDHYDAQEGEYPLVRGERGFHLLCGSGAGLVLGTVGMIIGGATGMVDGLNDIQYIPLTSAIGGALVEATLRPIQRLFNWGKQREAAKGYQQKLIRLRNDTLETLATYRQNKDLWNVPMPSVAHH